LGVGPPIGLDLSLGMLAWARLRSHLTALEKHRLPGTDPQVTHRNMGICAQT